MTFFRVASLGRGEGLPEGVGGQRRSKGYEVTAHGMDELDMAGHQGDTSIGIAALVAILQVATYRTSYRSELHTYLMLSPCLKIDLKEMIAL